MSNRERVYAKLKEMSDCCADTDTPGVAADEIARLLNMKRNVVSHLLNELHQDGKIIKINTRPVYFLDRDIYEKKPHNFEQVNRLLKKVNRANTAESDPFDKFIGSKGSLKIKVEQCKSAVTYPPNGLPVLLCGSTGVGKSYMAQLMHNFACSSGVTADNSPFVIFNCAEYANNPELLSTNIFGYSKGAFTGADKDKPGLLEEADGGYFFLDEIHRLPPEGQEKLFLFLDKGIFRRIGESGVWRTANIRFIFATTEEPEKNLLDTFLRRIPLIIKIPALSDRPLYERLQIIYHFYKMEAASLDKDIVLSRQVINFLLRSNISGNIGMLSNIIKYSCAYAYNREITNRNISKLNINLTDLPVDFVTSNKESINKNIYTNSVLVECRGKEDDVAGLFNYNDSIEKINDKIYELLESYTEAGISNERVTAGLLNLVDEVCDSLIFAENNNDNFIVYNIMINFLENVLAVIERNYGIKYYGNAVKVLTSLALYFSQKSYDEKIDRIDYFIEILRKLYPKEYKIASGIIEMIESNIDIRLSRAALIHFTVYIKSINKTLNPNRPNSIIIAHGYSTASSITSVANRLVGDYIFEAFDMGIDVSVKEIMEEVKKYLRDIDTSKDLILLVDMGSLEEFYKYLVDVVDGDIGIVNNITTQIALDVGFRILQSQTVEQIINEISKHNNSKFKFIKSSRVKKKAIITTCITGIGMADKIRELLSKCIHDENIEIIAYDYYRLKGNGINDSVFSEYDVRLIIGIDNPKIDKIPYLSLEELIAGNGDGVLKKVLMDFSNNSVIENINQEMVKMFSLQNVLNHLIILNPDKILDQVERAVADIEIGLGFKFLNELKISLYIHLSNLIERLVMKDPMIVYEDIENFIKCHRQFIKIFKNSFSVIESFYKIEIPEAEIGYVYDIIKLKAENKL